MLASRNPVKDLIIAFGAVSAVVTIYQIIESERAKKHAGKEHQAILAALERIESKLK